MSGRSAAWRSVLLAAFVALVWLRMPEIMRHGRFWAEEGRVYFVNAVTLPWWRALFRPEVGYLNLPANVAGLCARAFAPLEDAPHVTTAIAMALQCLPAVLLITARDGWLRQPFVRAAAVLLLAEPVAGDEVWLNTINSQFHIAVAAALCLALEPACGAAAAGRLVLVTLAPLCSPATVALAPLFVARGAWERSRGRVLQACGIILGAACQFAVFYHPLPERGQGWGPSILASAVAARHLALPFLGRELAMVLAGDLQDSLHQAQRPIFAILLVAAAGSGLACAVLWRRSLAAFWLASAALALGILSYAGALGAGLGYVSAEGSLRYAFAPSVLTGLTLLSLAATGADRLAGAAWVFVLWLLTAGCLQAALPHQADVANGPRWRDEVARWRADPSHELAIWPAGWTVRLPAKR